MTQFSVLLGLLCLLLISVATNATRLTSSDASCVLEAVAASGYQEGLVPFLQAKLFIHGTATFGVTENQADVAWGAFSITNTSNGYKFFPRRASTTRGTTGSTLTTFTFPFVEYSTQAGDIEISYSELPFQPSELMVNTTIHVTSFAIACTNTVSPYLYNAHVFGTVAEFLFTEPVVRCDNRSNETISKDWFTYSNRACEADTAADDTQCVKTFPKTVSICASDLKPVDGNGMRWWCNYFGNLTNGWSLETYFIQYYLQSGVICSAARNKTVNAFQTGGIKVFRQKEGTQLIHPTLIYDSVDIATVNPGIQYVDIQFQFPVDADYIPSIAPYVQFDYYGGTKTAQCNYYSDAGFPDGQILRYRCSPTVELQVADTPSVALVGTSTSYIVYHVLNYSSTAALGVDFINYTSSITPTVVTDGAPGVQWTAITPTVEWIEAIYYVNNTALKIVGTQTMTSLPLRGNLICYDTTGLGRYDLSGTTRVGSTVYLTFSDEEALPNFAESTIYCYFLYMSPSSDAGYAVYPANAVAVTLEPDGDTSSNDDSVFSGVPYGWSVVLIVLLSAFAFLGLVLFTYLWMQRYASKSAAYKKLKSVMNRDS